MSIFRAILLVAAAAAMPAAALAAGPAAVPDVRVVDQYGREHALSSGLIGSDIAVMDFVFTDCASICPMSAARMKRLGQRLRRESDEGVVLLSISRKPQRDTPQKLASRAAQLGVEGRWYWLTGRQDAVTALLRSLQVDAPVPEAHAATFLIYDGSNGQMLRVNALPSDETPLYQAVQSLRARRGAVAAGR